MALSPSASIIDTKLDKSAGLTLLTPACLKQFIISECDKNPLPSVSASAQASIILVDPMESLTLSTNDKI